MRWKKLASINAELRWNVKPQTSCESMQHTTPTFPHSTAKLRGLALVRLGTSTLPCFNRACIPICIHARPRPVLDFSTKLAVGRVYSERRHQ